MKGIMITSMLAWIFSGSIAEANTVKEIYFAGGCFWGVEKYFSSISGVVDVTVGYANGKTANPTYEDVCYKNTGHAEAVHVKYAPEIISLEALTEKFFVIIDPTSVNRQGNDTGSQYRTGIYYVSDTDKEVISRILASEQKKFDKRIAVELKSLENYYLAEEYHQDYLKKNPNGYCHINFDSLEDVTPKKYDAKPSSEDIKKMLTPEQFDVTQNCGTEFAFTGEYWNNKEPGIYVDIVTGEPLFVSANKYDSGTGWPSFTKPISSDALIEKVDGTHGMVRNEVRSKIGNSHLGHVFDDGPKDQGGLRYCINSAALKFIPYDDMEKEGYGKYKELVEK